MIKSLGNVSDYGEERQEMKMCQYDRESKKAEEFINHEEILETLRYAEENKHNEALIAQILEKAKKRKGLEHREAMVLLDCDIEEKNQEIYALAEQIKKDFYGNRIVMFAPLYLSNYCVNGCVYCPYHAKNKHISRKKLTQEEIRKEVIALQDMGHKRLALETGEDPVNNPIEYVLESITSILNSLWHSSTTFKNRPCCMWKRICLIMIILTRRNNPKHIFYLCLILMITKQTKTSFATRLIHFYQLSKCSILKTLTPKSWNELFVIQIFLYQFNAFSNNSHLLFTFKKPRIRFLQIQFHLRIRF